MILLLHVGLTRVPQWYSGDGCAGLEGPSLLHAHVRLFGGDGDGWKAGLSWDYRMWLLYVASPE